MINAGRSTPNTHYIAEQILLRETRLQKTIYINFVNSLLHLDLIVYPLKLIGIEQLYTNKELRLEETRYLLSSYSYYIKYRKTVVYSPIFLSSEQILKINII